MRSFDTPLFAYLCFDLIENLSSFPLINSFPWWEQSAPN